MQQRNSIKPPRGATIGSPVAQFGSSIRLFPPRRGRFEYMPEEYWVYALRNRISGKMYVGLTGNLQRRLEEHNHPRGGSKKFTHRHKGEWTLVCRQRYDNKAEASKRERFLKTGRGREFLRTRLTQITG